MYTKIGTSDSFTFRFFLIAKESRHDYFSPRIDTARGGSRLVITPGTSTKRLFRAAPRAFIETNYVLFRANFRGIFYFQPLSGTTPATLFTWLDNCALSTPGVYPRHAISNRPSECKWREVKCGVIDHPASEWRISFLRIGNCY